MKLYCSNRVAHGRSAPRTPLFLLALLLVILNTGYVLATAQEKGTTDKKAETSENSEATQDVHTPIRVPGGKQVALKGIPLRDPATKPNLLDLSGFYNGSLTQGWLPPRQYGTLRIETADKNLPMPFGVGQFGGVDFDVRGVIQLSGQMIKKAGGDFPERVSGIKAGQKCKHLHFLHAANWAHKYYVESGIEIGSFVVHYANGAERRIPIVNGEDVGDWLSSQKDLKRATVAWSGHNKMEPVQVYKSTWDNPQPEVEITSLDYISKMTAGSPFLIAITLD